MFGHGWVHLAIPAKSNSLSRYLSVVIIFMQKNLRHHLIPSRDIDDPRILQSDWMRTFYPITCEPESSQIWGLDRKIENQKLFHLRLLPAKTIKKNFQKLYRTQFLAHSAYFRKNNSQNIELCHFLTPYGFLAS